MRMLVTGGAGFIGSCFVRTALASDRDLELVNVDLLTYAGNPANLEGVEESSGGRYRFVKADIADRAAMEAVFGEHKSWDFVVNLAAESHVDRSIESGESFVQTNIVGTSVLLDCARRSGVGRFLQVSTDEVYGSLGSEGLFTETSPLKPSSPYSASKAGADLLALAAGHTHGFEVLVTRCSNNYGPRQYPEKLIPLMILNAMHGKRLPVYGDGLNVRDWIHVEDHCSALLAVLRSGRPGEVYNIGSGGEMRNIDVVRMILEELGAPESLIEYVRDRPGHDRRYAIDASKVRAETGWVPVHGHLEGIRDTVRWYAGNRQWWEPLLNRNGAFPSQKRP
jgi:dTDP-glucose 4,6-dehydratase